MRHIWSILIVKSFSWSVLNLYDIGWKSCKYMRGLNSAIWTDGTAANCSPECARQVITCRAGLQLPKNFSIHERFRKLLLRNRRLVFESHYQFVGITTAQLLYHLLGKLIEWRSCFGNLEQPRTNCACCDRLNYLSVEWQSIIHKMCTNVPVNTLVVLQWYNCEL